MLRHLPTRQGPDRLGHLLCNQVVPMAVEVDVVPWLKQSQALIRGEALDPAPDFESFRLFQNEDSACIWGREVDCVFSMERGAACFLEDFIN